MYARIMVTFLVAGVLAAVALLASGRRVGLTVEEPWPAQVPLPGEAEAGLGRRLADVDLEGMTLGGAIDTLAQRADAQIVVRWNALKGAGVWPDRAVDVRLRNRSLSAALTAVLRQAGAELDYEAAEGVITVSTREDLQKDAVVRVYDVRDLLTDEFWPHDPPGTRAEYHGLGNVEMLSPEKVAAERFGELKAAFGAALGNDEDRPTVVGWSGRLVVTNTLARQRDVERALRQMRHGAQAEAGADDRQTAAAEAESEEEVGEEFEDESEEWDPSPDGLASADAALEIVLPEVALDGVTLEQGIDSLRTATRANIVVDWAAVESAGIRRDGKVRIRLWEVRLTTALAVLLAGAEDNDNRQLDFHADGEVILVSTKEALASRGELRAYDVRDIIAAAMNVEFALPRRGEPRRYLDDDDDRRIRREVADALISMIRGDVDPDSWRDNGGLVGTLTEWAGRLFIRQSRHGHTGVEGLLNRLRRELNDAPPSRGQGNGEEAEAGTETTREAGKEP